MIFKEVNGLFWCRCRWGGVAGVAAEGTCTSASPNPESSWVQPDVLWVEKVPQTSTFATVTQGIPVAEFRGGRALLICCWPKRLQSLLCGYTTSSHLWVLL